MERKNRNAFFIILVLIVLFIMVCAFVFARRLVKIEGVLIETESIIESVDGKELEFIGDGETYRSVKSLFVSENNIDKKAEDVLGLYYDEYKDVIEKVFIDQENIFKELPDIDMQGIAPYSNGLYRSNKLDIDGWVDEYKYVCIEDSFTLIYYKGNVAVLAYDFPKNEDRILAVVDYSNVKVNTLLTEKYSVGKLITGVGFIRDRYVKKMYNGYTVYFVKG